MKGKVLVILAAFLLTAYSNPVNAQSATILPGENTPNYSYVQTGDGLLGGVLGCNFNKSKGMLSLFMELQHDNTTSNTVSKIDIWYNGSWHEIFDVMWGSNPLNGVASNQYSWDVNRFTSSTSPTYTTGSNYLTLSTDNAAIMTTQLNTNAVGNGTPVYLKNVNNGGVMQRYDGNYLPVGGDVQNRVSPSDYANFSLQTDVYSNVCAYAWSNPSTSSGVQAAPGGFGWTNSGDPWWQIRGNIPGVGTFNCCDGNNQALFWINVVNLPPDMLESGDFRVHIYQLSNTSNTRIYEWVYKNQNFMNNAPTGLTATSDQCGKVHLTWSNSNNTQPSDGGTMTIKTAIFRNGTYLAMVGNSTTSYDDATAAQDVQYTYTVRHVAFTESQKTYFRSPYSNTVQGQVKPSPDQPISPAASSNDCASKINLSWSYNGANPQYFRIDTASSVSGTYGVLTNTLSGSSRSYTHSGVVRGKTYYYNLYAISTCSVNSTTAATCNGISPADPAMATNITATTNTVANSVDIAWTDNANNETKYEIVRTDDQGNTVLTQVNANSTSYSDNSVANCRLYTYKVRVYNDCVLSGITSTTSAQATLPPPNLSNTFDATHKLTASKGYFSNRVELSWSNNNSINIDYFKIYRKQLGSSLDSVQIATANSGSALYVDNTADARVLYRYAIVGVKNCNGAELLTNISSDNGFRNPTGQVSGHIEYNGGVAVKDVKVTVQNSAGNLEGNSLSFSNGGTVTIPDNTTLEPGAQMRLEFWIKPSAVTGSVINKNSAFDFGYTGSTWQARIYIGGVSKTTTASTAAFPNNQWTHVSMVYDGSYFRLFADGVVQDSVAASGSIDDNSNDLVIGSATAAFKIDEMRLTGTAVSNATIANENSRILFGNETGFKCNLHFDEAFGNYAYDVSQANNVYNGNHGLMSTANVVWSSDIPTNSQLGYFGLTDNLGNYSVSGIRYLGSGENFNLIPVYQTHSFTPNSRSVFIGDGSSVFGNQDFTDNSSFSFTGTLFYKGTTCPVPGAGLKIDGLPVIANGQQATTDVAGTFSISVPIGNHYVSIDLFGHDMESGRYPATGVHDFQAPISGVQFSDSTHRILLGRVVGGLIEANKVPGLGRSNNNIGKTYIKLVSPISGPPCHTETVVTNDTSGEYYLRVTPLTYRIDSVYVITNPNIINASTLSNTNQVIDMTTALTLTNVVDTLKDTLGGVISIDSVKYNKRLDMVYRVSPTLDVKRASDGYLFIGEDSVSISSTQKISIKQTSPSNPWGAFGLPVFEQNKTYKAKIYAWEIYTNTDHALKDSVKLNGNVVITNDMVDGSDPNSHLTMQSGVATYSFTCGSPNIASNSTYPALSYAKELQINVIPAGSASKSWLPNAVTSYSTTTSNYYGYVIGQKITGTGIATQGPDKVDFILRDPPGSGGSATWTAGQAFSTQTDVSASVSAEEEMSAKVAVGTKEEVGLGVATDVDIEANNTIGETSTINASMSSSFIETTSSSYAVSTSSDPGSVGAPADIFIGRSRNWLVGPTMSVELIDTAKCAAAGGCFGTPVNGKSLVILPGYAVAPADVKTRFSYTQNEIENDVIPTLESIRATFLNGTNPAYTTTLSASDPRFGSNNDDPIWTTQVSTTSPKVYDKADTTGPSYTFRGRYLLKEDSVRTINNQIALWKQALAQNEREKIACLNHTPGYTFLDNFTLGSAIVTNSYETDSEVQLATSFELSLSESEGLELKGEFAGTGVEGETNLTLNTTLGGGVTGSSQTSNNLEYTLTDGDPDDIMSVDVYATATGNVFITRGGQTMCPYEDAIVCHYYDPANPTAFIGSHTYNANGFFTIQNATVQREMPNISITPAVQYNIPSSQAASYQLTLTNQSPLTVNNDIDLRVYVAATSNPNGAILKIDGQAADAIFTIPTGGAVIKTLTVERGPIQIDYDSLMIVFASACGDGIADTAYISVHFIPTCTNLSFNAPTNNFIVNNTNPDSVNVIISNYDYNYGVASNNDTATNAAHPNYGFEKVGFEFKPSNSSTWLAIQEFSKSPTTPQLLLPTGQAYTQYSWGVPITSYPDGNYELRSVSYCYNFDGTYAKVISPVIAGVMDRVNPGPFGTPSPADGILDPNDDIYIQFNEPIDGSSLSYAPGANFDIRGVLNGTSLRNAESLNFDGVSNYAEVSGGASLQKRSFTFEFWAKVNTLGVNQTVISQGADPVQNLTIGFDNSNKLVFTLGNQSASSTGAAVADNNWHHFAVVYDYANATASLYTDGALIGTNNNFLVDYVGSGKLAFGKALPAGNNFFAGNLHEVRLWNVARTLGDIASTMNIVLNSNQSGLLYNWRMDEATGSVAADYIRSRNADIYGATWEVNPNGNAVQFDGIDDNIQISAGTLAINKEMDFTLEFWFNSTQAGIATLFANGKGDGLGADSLYAWNIQKDGAGAIHVYHKGLDFVATSTNYFDGTWHHFSLVMDRKANLSCYIDGNLQNSVSALSFNSLAGAYMYLGARGYQTGSVTNYDNYLNGKMDEFRLWNTARKAEQIKRDKQNRMLGDEIGLQAFLPFEHYALVLGTPSLTPTFADQSANADTVNPQNGVQLITTTPTIKLPRPIQEVNYTYSLNNDKIILTTTTDPALLENVTLDVTVKNVYDMHGNKMQSPKTWIAYVNKNQVKWQDAGYSFSKTVDSVITFIAPIVNSGGAQKTYTVSGLPTWLSTTSTTGVIAPNSTQNIVFTIPAGNSIGDFSSNISLTTDFGYAEILKVDLSVRGVAPTWTVNPSNFQYSMNVFGQIKIDGVISTNPENMIAAFNHGVICGVAYLQYIPAYDRYEAFLNVYDNTVSGDTLVFNIYDAGSGLTFVSVTPDNMTFVENDVVGTVSNPVTFSANTEISRLIPLNAGWNWVSFPLLTANLQNSNLLLSSLHPTTGDVAESNTAFDQYDASLGWLGNISQASGYYNNQSYKIKVAVADTLIHTGTRINPDSSQAAIQVVPGWNWIGFVSNKNVALSTALGNYNAVTGDLIKSQYEFAYYDNLTGWTGSLVTMRPTMGYMLKSSSTSTFHYPLSVFYGKYAQTNDDQVKTQSLYPFKPELYGNTMSAILKGNICHEVLGNGDIALGAFDANDNLRGYAYPILQNSDYLFYLTLYSNTSGEPLSLRYFNNADGSELSTAQTVNFVTESLAGTPSNPVIANVQDSLACLATTGIVTANDSKINCSVYPNPFTDHVTLSFNKPVSVKLEFVDLLGKVLYSTSVSDKKEVNLTADVSKLNLTSGMYYIRLTGDLNKQIKIVKTR